MGELTLIHLGHCGINIGAKFWELAMNETILDKLELEKKQILYHETIKGKLNPRCVFIDNCDDIIKDVYNYLRYKSEEFIFDKKCCINGKEDAAENYSRGHYTIGKEIIDDCLDQIRIKIEGCDRAQGIIVTHSMTGGTGSGTGSLLFERLSVEYTKIPKFSFHVVPSPDYKDTIVAPYNWMKAQHSMIEHADASILFDNQ